MTSTTRALPLLLLLALPQHAQAASTFKPIPVQFLAELGATGAGAVGAVALPHANLF